MEDPTGQGYPAHLIDAKSAELIAEFKQHRDESLQIHPDASTSRIFEGWALQKIAGLQVVVLGLAERMNEMEMRENLRSGHN